jgi:excinuclease ABC subunit B
VREGLDLPEVSLVAILDADKEGFLRSERSLIPTSGRAARNVHGRVILYADTVTDSMRRALDETQRRRHKQLEFNREHGITPRTIEKSVADVLRSTSVADAIGAGDEDEVRGLLGAVDAEGPEALIARMEAEMLAAAKKLEFERAASLRDRIDEIRAVLAESTRRGVEPVAAVEAGRRARPGGARPREPRRIRRRFGSDR